MHSDYRCSSGINFQNPKYGYWRFMIMSSSEERQSELDKLLDTIDKSLDRDLSRLKAGLHKVSSGKFYDV
jgi:hypothetical protein